MTISRNISVMAQGANTAGILAAPYGGSPVWQAVQTANFAAAAGNAYPAWDAVKDAQDALKAYDKETQ